jgi:hypothetical protein
MPMYHVILNYCDKCTTRLILYQIMAGDSFIHILYQIMAGDSFIHILYQIMAGDSFIHILNLSSWRVIVLFTFWTFQHLTKNDILTI